MWFNTRLLASLPFPSGITLLGLQARSPGLSETVWVPPKAKESGAT